MVKKKTAKGPRKGTAGKSAADRSAAKRRPSVSRVKKKMTKKASAAKKAPAVKKKASAAKKAPAGKKKAPAAKKAVAKVAPKPKRRGRITKMTVQETLISLTSLEGTWQEFEWLHGLILYGPGLRRVPVHREFSFMVVYRGLRNPAQLRQAKVDLDKRIRAAVPVKRHLHFVSDFDVLRRVEADDPAFIAVLGHAITIYARASS